MTIYYLYLKTHNITGLKYLGQTKQDPFIYKGSGKEWRAHLKLFGNLVSTEILLSTDNKEVRNFWGRFYSRIWNVVGSQDDFGNKIYANKIPETGCGGGQRYGWKGLKGNKNGMHGTSRKGNENPFYGKKHTAENIFAATQRKTHNTGKTNIELYGAVRAAEIANANKIAQQGQKRGNWYNNGSISVIKTQCPLGFVKGRLKKSSSL